MANPNELDELLTALDDNLPRNKAEREYEFWKAPDVLDGIRSGTQPFGEILGPEEVEEFRAMLSGLIGLFFVRHFGDANAPAQINAIHKLIFPGKFGVPRTAIESFAKKYEGGHIVRAMALRRLMHEMADLIELADPEAENPSSSTVSVSPGANQKHPLYLLVRQNCRRGTTLRSLAIRVYLGLIQKKAREEDEDSKIDENSLGRDLRRLSQWEKADKLHTRILKEYAAAPGQYHWKARIPVRLYSESFTPETPADADLMEISRRLRESEGYLEE